MISRGVPAGANVPYQVSTAYPGTPASATVGKCGTACERFALTTASARSRPAFTCGMVDTALAAVTEMRPATRSRMLGAVPLYGTCTILTPAMRVNISIARCCGLPLPEDDHNSSFGCALASAISSLTERTGTDGCTASTLGESTSSVIGAKSLTASNVSLYRLGGIACATEVVSSV